MLIRSLIHLQTQHEAAQINAPLPLRLALFTRPDLDTSKSHRSAVGTSREELSAKADYAQITLQPPTVHRAKPCPEGQQQDRPALRQHLQNPRRCQSVLEPRRRRGYLRLLPDFLKVVHQLNYELRYVQHSQTRKRAHRGIANLSCDYGRYKRHVVTSHNQRSKRRTPWVTASKKQISIQRLKDVF